MPRAIVNGLTLANNATPVDFNFGDGSLGDVVISGDVELQGDLHYNSLIVNDGVRVSAVAMTKLIIRTRGDLTLLGSAVIDAHGRGFPSVAGGSGSNAHGALPARASDGNSASRGYTALAAGGAGGGGGGGGRKSGSGAGGDGGNAGTASNVGDIYAATGSSIQPDFSIIGRRPSSTNNTKPHSDSIVIPANTLTEDGDTICLIVHATPYDPAGGSNEGLTVTLGGVTLFSDTATGFSTRPYHLLCHITRPSSGVFHAICVGTLADDAYGSVDWTTDLSLTALIEGGPLSTGGTIHSIVAWKLGSSSSSGGNGGVAPPNSSTIAGAGSQGPAVVDDATIRARIEGTRDLAAISSIFWGSPGSGGGGGGGAHGSVVSSGSAGGSPGAQSGAAGFGHGNDGGAGVDITADTGGDHGTGGGGGGAGGAGGGDLEVWCGRNLTIGTGSINANGGNGGNGGRGGNITVIVGSAAGCTGGGGGGGGGGSGGTVVVVVNGEATNVSTVNVTATGGSGGTGGAAGTIVDTPTYVSQPGGSGANGRDGGDGYVVLIGA